MNNTIKKISNNFPAALEYLSQIYLIKRDYGVVNNARLADRLNVSRPAVSQVIKRLKKIELILQDKYGTINLSKKGNIIAKETLRRHYLIEHVLVRILEFPWDKSDAEAMELQDKISEELTEHIFEKLGKPETCPHGNPLPGSKNEDKILNAKKLTEIPENIKIKIIRITEEGEQVPEMLSFCYNNKIKPGLEVSISKKSQNNIKLTLNNNENILVPIKFAKHIRIEKTQIK